MGKSFQRRRRNVTVLLAIVATLPTREEKCKYYTPDCKMHSYWLRPLVEPLCQGQAEVVPLFSVRHSIRRLNEDIL